MGVVVAIAAVAALLVRAADNEKHESADGEDEDNCNCEHGYHLPTDSKVNTIRKKVQSYLFFWGPCGNLKSPPSHKATEDTYESLLGLISSLKRFALGPVRLWPH